MTPLIETKNLSKTFISQGKSICALRNTSLSLGKNETLGIVGESGSGKTTFGKLLMGLFTPTSGEILYRGQPITQKDRQAFQYIFQDPYASLNPRMCVEDIIGEPLHFIQACGKHERQDKIEEVMELVGLNPLQKKRYPSEFSGGQRQRISIARALITRPECIICDEPTTALDVSIQAQILHLLMQLQDELGLSYVFISHNLAVVQYISHRVGVFYKGEVVEENDVSTLFQTPRHEYTKELIQSVPKVISPVMDTLPVS